MWIYHKPIDLMENEKKMTKYHLTRSVLCYEIVSIDIASKRRSKSMKNLDKIISFQHITPSQTMRIKSMSQTQFASFRSQKCIFRHLFALLYWNRFKKLDYMTKMNRNIFQHIISIDLCYQLLIESRSILVLNFMQL